MSKSYDSLAARDAAALCPTYARYPVAIARGEGARLFDLDGKVLIDLLGGIAVTSLGHCHPEVAQAISDQARRLVHVSNLFLTAEQVALAEKLSATRGGGKAFFCNSGAEANEAALKLVRRYMHKVRGRDAHEVVTLEGSFHGRTLATLTATGQIKVQDGYAPLPQGFRSVPFDDLNALAEAVTPKTAAVMIEIIQGEIGVRPLSADFLHGLKKLCREREILLIVDEIQTGLCRTGRFWAYEHFGLAPDIVTCAKPLANGLPMGAMLATDEVAAGFTPGSHGTTFGGGPLVCAAALKVLEIMERDDLAGRARDLGEYLRGLLLDLKAEMPDKVAAVRGMGLMLAVDLGVPGKPVWEELLEMGLVVNLEIGRAHV